MRRGNLFVISGPSGAGKGTLVALLLDRVPDAWLSVSATTRSPRPGEVDGQSYRFLERERFQELIDAGELLEWAEYSGNFYGTPKASVQEAIDQGRQVILEIEVQGALQVREKMPQAKLVFIEPPSLQELERRLRNRGTESDEAIDRRMAAAEVELSIGKEYDIQLVNDNLEQAADALVAYVNEQAEGTRG